jgi:hypothetical protein
MLLHQQVFNASPKTKLECLSRFRCLLLLTLRSTYDCTEVSADGIQKREPSTELQGVLREAGEDYKGFEIEVLETIKAAKFDVVNNKVIDLKSKTLIYNCSIYHCI